MLLEVSRGKGNNCNCLKIKRKEKAGVYPQTAVTCITSKREKRKQEFTLRQLLLVLQVTCAHSKLSAGRRPLISTDPKTHVLIHSFWLCFSLKLSSPFGEEEGREVSWVLQ